MANLSTEGIKCSECVKAVTLNTAEVICIKNGKDGNICRNLKEKVKKGELSVGEYLKKIKEQCTNDTCSWHINELIEFFKEEYES